MADVTIAAPGQAGGSGDRLTMFLKVFVGEVLAAFTERCVTNGKHIERTITSGRSAQFPGFGRATAAYLKPGGNLDDIRVNIQNFERTIQIDGLLTSDCMISDIDEAMAHYDFRAEYSRQLGEALAKAQDGAILAEIAKMVVEDKENLTGLGKGKILTTELAADDIGETEAMGVALFKQILEVKTLFSDNSVPEEDRYIYIRPVALNALIANKDVINKLYGATMTIEGNNPPRLVGFQLIETPNLTIGGAPKNDGVLQGEAHVFPATYVDTCMFIAAHRTAVGVLTLKGLSMEHARRANYQADEIIAKYAKGFGGLRPEAAAMGVITQSA